MTVKYEELEIWQKAFYDLNMKLGNDVWGARLEDGPDGNMLMKIFINDAALKETVLAETNGRLAGHEIVFEVYSQEEYAKSISEKQDG